MSTASGAEVCHWCRIAGLDVIRIINEPTAAVMAYYHEQKLAQEGCRGKQMPWDFLKRGTIDLSKQLSPVLTALYQYAKHAG